MDFTFKRALGAGLLAFSVATVFSLQAEETATPETAADDCIDAAGDEKLEVAMMMGGSGMGGMGMGGTMAGGAMSGGNMGNMAGGAMAGGNMGNTAGGAMSGGNMGNTGGTMTNQGTMSQSGAGTMQRVDAGCEAGSADCVNPVAVSAPIVEVEDQQAAMLAQVDSSKCNPAKAEAEVN